jgi:hypothetical protein
MKQPVVDAFDFRLMRRGMKPRTLTRLTMPLGTKECLGGLATSVFTEASNAGQTFQEALLAVYMTGLENGRAAVTGEKT